VRIKGKSGSHSRRSDRRKRGTPRHVKNNRGKGKKEKVARKKGLSIFDHDEGKRNCCKRPSAISLEGGWKKIKGGRKLGGKSEKRRKGEQNLTHYQEKGKKKRKIGWKWSQGKGCKKGARVEHHYGAVVKGRAPRRSYLGTRISYGENATGERNASVARGREKVGGVPEGKEKGFHLHGQGLDNRCRNQFGGRK